jgi:tetratricopeptide (TPR) repeat protein
VNRTDERDATGQRGAEEPRATEPLARSKAEDQIVVGAIPAQRPGLQPRPVLLGQLSRASQGASVVVLTGPQGAGKTQSAAAYARARLASGWRLIAWVNAQDSESVRTGLAAVADATGLSVGGSGRSAAEVGYAVRHWLEADGKRCLLVFGDAEDPEVLRPFVPVEGAARVLITAARESVAELGTSVLVDVFSAEEALALLDGRTGLADEAGAAAVAAELGYLPLAVDQAAAVIAGRRLQHAAYLTRLRALPAEENLEPYPQGAAEAILLSLEAIRAADPSGVCTRVLEIMAVLSPAGVRRDLLRAAGEAGVLASGEYTADPVLVDQALDWLTGRSLLTFTIDGSVVVMHQLVARVTRERLARRGQLTAVCLVAASILDARAEALAGSEDRMAVREIPQQVSALLDNAAGPEGEADDKLTRRLLKLRFWALYHLIELGDSMTRAIAVGESLTADLDRVLGPDHLETLNSRNSLAVAYQAADRVAEAVSLLEQTVAVQTRLLGSDHPDTLMSQNNLAAAYRDVGRSAEAILLFERTLAARERVLGPDHSDTMRSRNNLARAYRKAGPTE